jgi:hypothetical protein
MSNMEIGDAERRAVSRLTRDMIEPNAVDRLLDLYQEALGFTLDDQAQLGSLTVQFQAHADELTTGNLAERWMLLVALVQHAQGIAAGRERKRIEYEDVETVHETLCDHFPKCAPMRVDLAAEALNILAPEGGAGFPSPLPSPLTPRSPFSFRWPRIGRTEEEEEATSGPDEPTQGPSAYA